MSDENQQQQLMDARIDIARLEVQVTHLGAQIVLLQESNLKQDQNLQKILTTLSEAKGGWKTLMWVGGAAGVLGSALTGLIGHFSK